ncbi:MAG: HEAT repeat domain-containing protein [Gemmatimonadota bacterium]
MSILRYSSALLLALATAAGAQSSCPSGNDDVRVAALSGLAQVESDQVLPVMRKVLERRDECSVSLRRQVISMLTRSRFGEQTDLFLTVARNDPSTEVRRAALNAIAQVNSERSAAALDSVVFNAGDSDLRETALRALAQQSAPAARQSLHRAAELTTLPLDLRMRAVSYTSSYNKRYPEDTQFLMSLYSKTDSPELRDAIMRSVANQRVPEATTWLLAIARDKSRDIDHRRQALSAVGQAARSNGPSGATSIDLKTLIGLYDDFGGQIEMQDRMIDVMSQLPDQMVTDKLLQLARSEGNVDLRRKAILRVGQRKDPRVRDFLLEVLSK